MQMPVTPTIEIQGKTSGWIFYHEGGQRLPFPWKNLPKQGCQVALPPAHAWVAFCQQHGAPWAIPRGQEIIQRLAERLLRDYQEGATWQVGDDGASAWLNVYGKKITRLSFIIDSLDELFS
jgi:hypothetical protein